MGQNPGEAEERGEDSAPGRGGWLGKSTRGETPFGQKMKFPCLGGRWPAGGRL